ncbi:hypothetical protein PilKf_02165 [Pillotina sp. SPG140]|jgi:hypothetical protein
MYTREFQKPRKSPLEESQVVVGTWNQIFESTDLSGVRKPLGIFMPSWLQNYRLKEWESFSIYHNSLSLELVFTNLKYYQSLFLFLYDRVTKEQYYMSRLLPFTSRKLSKTLLNSSLEIRTHTLFFRVHNWLAAHTIALDLDIEASLKRPPLTLHISFEVPEHFTPLTVNMLMGERQPLYMCKLLSPLEGDVMLGGTRWLLKSTNACGIVCDGKGYYPYRSHALRCMAAGVADNGLYGFSVGENQAKNPYQNNENALWYNGVLTAFPPVHITMPNGIESEWIIQDLEGMVDLVFTPQEYIRSTFNALVNRIDYIALFGYYNGDLVDLTGNHVPIRTVWGQGEKLYMRV